MLAFDKKTFCMTSTGPMVGASGAISGILGAFLESQLSAWIGRRRTRRIAIVCLEAVSWFTIAAWLVVRTIPARPDRTSSFAWHFLPGAALGFRQSFCDRQPQSYSRDPVAAGVGRAKERFADVREILITDPRAPVLQGQGHLAPSKLASLTRRFPNPFVTTPSTCGWKRLPASNPWWPARPRPLERALSERNGESRPDFR